MCCKQLQALNMYYNSQVFMRHQARPSSVARSRKLLEDFYKKRFCFKGFLRFTGFHNSRSEVTHENTVHLHILQQCILLRTIPEREKLAQITAQI